MIPDVPCSMYQTVPYLASVMRCCPARCSSSSRGLCHGGTGPVSWTLARLGVSAAAEGPRCCAYQMDMHLSTPPGYMSRRSWGLWNMAPGASWGWWMRGRLGTPAGAEGMFAFVFCRLALEEPSFVNTRDGSASMEMGDFWGDTPVAWCLPVCLSLSLALSLSHSHTHTPETSVWSS